VAGKAEGRNLNPVVSNSFQNQSTSFIKDGSSQQSFEHQPRIYNGKPVQPTLIDKQVKEVSKQKELLMKLQREKEELEAQMKQNDRVIQKRMEKLHEERKQMEDKILKSSITIQRYARGFIQRLKYAKLAEEATEKERGKLQSALADMQNQIQSCFLNIDDTIEAKVLLIQRAVRKMISRKNFRVNLYKLILTKNIVENKVHRERMSMLYAFEQMIINTEIDGDYGDEEGLMGGDEIIYPGSEAVMAESGETETATYIDDDGVEQEVVFYKGGQNPYYMDAALAGYKDQPLTEQERLELIEQDYNPSEIIQEEEYEDSEDGSPVKERSLM
jgi:hypothetical protein